MSFKALILLKSRELIIHRANATRAHFRYGDGIYVITDSDIQNVDEDGKIRGAEAIYFEGNPNAVSYTKPKSRGEDELDPSSVYLNEIVIMNALKQTGSGPRFDFPNILSYLAPLKDPVTLMYILFIGVILYGVLSQALGYI